MSSHLAEGSRPGGRGRAGGPPRPCTRPRRGLPRAIRAFGLGRIEAADAAGPKLDGARRLQRRGRQDTGAGARRARASRRRSFIAAAPDRRAADPCGSCRSVRIRAGPACSPLDDRAAVPSSTRARARSKRQAGITPRRRAGAEPSARNRKLSTAITAAIAACVLSSTRIATAIGASSTSAATTWHAAAADVSRMFAAGHERLGLQQPVCHIRKQYWSAASHARSGERFALPVSALAIDPEQDRMLGEVVGGTVHQGGHLPRVQRMDAAVVLARGEEGWPDTAGPSSRCGGARARAANLNCSAFSADPYRAPRTWPSGIAGSGACPAAGPQTTAGVKIGPLRRGRAGEQSAVASAEDREPLGLRPAVLHELLGRRIEVVETFCLRSSIPAGATARRTRRHRAG